MLYAWLPRLGECRYPRDTRCSLYREDLRIWRPSCASTCQFVLLLGRLRPPGRPGFYSLHPLKTEWLAPVVSVTERQEDYGIVRPYQEIKIKMKKHLGDRRHVGQLYFFGVQLTVNTILWAHTAIIYSWCVYGCFYDIRAVWNCDLDPMVQKALNIYYPDICRKGWLIPRGRVNVCGPVASKCVHGNFSLCFHCVHLLTLSSLHRAFLLTCLRKVVTSGRCFLGTGRE